MSFNLTLIPLGLKGNVYRSPMPFCDRKLNEDAFKDLKANRIATIVLLCPDEECQHKTGLNLRQLYLERGLKVIHFPLKDRQIPAKAPFYDLIDRIHEIAKSGENILIHCRGGNTRTGFVVSALAKKVLNLTGDQAVRWAMEKMSAFITTPPLTTAVNAYLPKNLGEKAIPWPVTAKL